MKISKIFTHPLFLTALCIYALMMLSATSLAQTENALNAAIELHNKGRNGNSEATTQAIEILKDIVKNQPDNALAISYLGSSYSLAARDSKEVVNKIRYTNRGLRFLDQAVAMSPEDFIIRFIRANVTSSLPEMFGRGDDTVKDMLVLDQIYTAAKSPSMAVHMVEIYEKLDATAKDQSNWAEKANAARKLADTP